MGKATLTITANNAYKTYDGLAYSGGNGVIYTGFVNDETASVLGGSLMYGGTAQGAIKTGNYTIIPTGNVSDNYNVTYQNGSLSIAPSASKIIPLQWPSSYVDLNKDPVLKNIIQMSPNDGAKAIVCSSGRNESSDHAGSAGLPRIQTCID